ncbi:hypothetical protein LOAG_10691 [Loa loa]|uniref:Uncharacterized protein n=1 Tax=Loa loa TaxID=7209 RepID=A0A1S0TPC6_LOALO|nr:hypothetical protein LOAG_10691 [Loa loa]EFO17806.1 hypothetical protein LOAG_10691 [Loa loa]
MGIGAMNMLALLFIISHSERHCGTIQRTKCHTIDGRCKLTNECKKDASHSKMLISLSYAGNYYTSSYTVSDIDKRIRNNSGKLNNKNKYYKSDAIRKYLSPNDFTP